MSELIPDYYAVLGVGRSASEKEIQKAYRRCALQAHPDRNPGEPDQSDSPDIRVINEAWDVLGDPLRRAAYDQLTGAESEEKNQAGIGWEDAPNVPAVPPGFDLHPRPTGVGVQADYAAYVESARFIDARALDMVRSALSLYAETADLSNLSRLGDDDLWLLDARRLPVSDSELRAVGRFHKLTVLRLDDTNVTDAGLHSLRRLPALERLSLTACRITDAGMPTLAGIRSLRKLEINETRVTDDGLAALDGHPALTALDIRSTKVRGDGIRHLADLPELTELLVNGRALRAASEIFAARPEVTVL